MPLDPQAKTLLDQFAAAGAPALEHLSPTQAREVYGAIEALHGPPPPMHHVEDRAIPGPAGDIPVRIYRPRDTSPLPALVYFHGGGWVIGSLDSHDGVCRALAKEADCVVVSVDYRLAPEHRFPAAPEDAYAATCWVSAHASEVGADPVRIAVGGDSAGGNLAAVVALMARDRGAPALVFQLLIYPAVDSRFDTSSHEENAEGYFLTRGAMKWFWDHYAPGDTDRRSPYAAPLRAEHLGGLPPALVLTAEFDPLRDEGEAYARRLSEAGVAAEAIRYDGMFHGFFGLTAVIDRSREAISTTGRALRNAFAARR